MMPNYDYLCDNCEHRFDYRQAISSDPLRVCPKCDEETVRRLISKGGGLIFKGDGFYCTDYKSTQN